MLFFFGDCTRTPADEDRYPMQVYKRDQEELPFYGTQNIDDDTLRDFYDQFRCWRTFRMSEDAWSVEYEKTILTIDPPLDVVRNLDIELKKSKIRGVLGDTYLLREVDVSDVHNVNIIDGFFAFGRHELDDASKFEAMYNSRLKLFSNVPTSLLDFALPDVPRASLYSPNYGVLLHAGGASGMLRDKRRDFIPKFFDIEPEKIESHAKTKRFSLNRQFSVDFPISKSSINSLYLEKATRGVIFESGDKRWGKPILKITSKNFNETFLSDAYLATLNLDLAYDVGFTGCDHPIVTPNKLTQLCSSPMVGFDSVDAGFDEKMAIICQKGIVNDWGRFFTTRLLAPEYAETFMLCVKNIFLQYIHSQVPSIKVSKEQLQTVIDWADEHLNLSDNAVLGTIHGGFIGGTVGELRSALNYDAAIDKDVTEDEKFVKSFEKFFGPGTEVKMQLPVEPKGSYEDILNDSLYGIARFVSNGISITFNTPKIPLSVVRDATSAGKVAEMYANYKLKQLIDLW